MLQFTFTFRAMKFFLHIYMYPFILSCCWSSSRTIPCISKLSPCQAAYHFLAGYQNGKFVPAYSDSPSIDTLEFAKALSSEICKSIHLFMLKDNQIPSLLVNVKEGEKSLTEAAKTSSPIRWWFLAAFLGHQFLTFVQSSLSNKVAPYMSLCWELTYHGV